MSDYQNLFAALAKAQGEMDALIASSTANIKSEKANFSYKYADLADVLRVALKTLSKHGLGIVQIPEVVYDSNTTIVSIAATLFHASGEFMPIAPLPLRVRPNATAQEVGSAITYARRYQLQSVLGLAADDDDGAAATESAKRQRSQPQHRQPVQAQQPTDEPPVEVEFMDNSPTDEQFTSEPPPIGKPKAGQVTKPQLNILHALGTAAYNGEWDAKRPELVRSATKGRTESSAELWQAEAQTLTSGLEKKVRKLYGEMVEMLTGSLYNIDPNVFAEIDSLSGVELAREYSKLVKMAQGQPEVQPAGK